MFPEFHNIRVPGYIRAHLTDDEYEVLCILDDAAEDNQEDLDIQQEVEDMISQVRRRLAWLRTLASN